VLKEAHVGNAQVQAQLYATYRREYENFTHLPGESIDALFQRFTMVVNNMRANVDVLPYDYHDRDVKLLHQSSPASHHSRCTPTTNKIAPLVLCKSIHIHFHHFTSSHPPLLEKTPKAMADKGKQPLEENSFPPKKRTFRE
jgi:hypothetical protein